MKTLSFITLVFCPYFASAQEVLGYQGKNESVEFAVSQDQYCVAFRKEDKVIVQKKAVNFTSLSETSLLFTASNDARPFAERRKLLLIDFGAKVERIEPVLVYKDGTRQICQGQLTLKLAGNVTLDQLMGDRKYEAFPDLFVKDQYLVTIQDVSTEQLFLLAGELNKSKQVEFAEPNFTRLLKPHTNDQFYNSQWAINNQGYLGGTVDADMDVDGAWTYAIGQGVKVAIIDEGVDLSHPDLASNLLSGYDATGNNSLGAPQGDDSHGTNCAGIVAAVANNGIGIAGIASSSKILPVRIAFGLPNGAWQTSDSWIANGINWAVNNGADILSCSWGGGSPSNSINNAIDNAVNNGRNVNGLVRGCVVLFSSGNGNSGVSYPASRGNVIAVGASSMCDQRKTPTSCDGENWWGSNFGTGIDIVAPGVKIYSTDISGSAGYSSNNYFPSFNGTSAACPHAAATAALILSLNPNLSQAQVRQILETKTDKITGYTYLSNVSGQPNGTWNNEVGYGRVNACQAVVEAFKSVPINGPSVVCATAAFALQTQPVSAVVSWSTSNSSGLSINPTTGLATRQNNFNGLVTITASVTGGCGSVNVTRVVNVGNYTPMGISSVNSNCSGSTFNVLNTSLSGICTANSPIYFAFNITDPNYSNFVYTPVSVPAGATWSGGGGSLTMTVYTPPTSGSRSATIALSANGPCGAYNQNFTSTAVNIYGGFRYATFPNPTSKTLTIEQIPIEVNGETVSFSNESSAEPGYYRLYDFNNSKVVLEGALAGKTDVDVSKLKKGKYILKIQIERNEVETHQVIVE